MGSKIRRTGKFGHVTDRHRKNLQPTQSGVVRHGGAQGANITFESTRNLSHNGDATSSPNSEAKFSSTLAQAPSQQTSQTQFRFRDLPRDIAIYMLKSMLIAPEGIVNPWMKRDELEDYYPRTTSAYTWRTWLRPCLLATCRTFHELGTPMLYGYNTFRLIRLPYRVDSSSRGDPYYFYYCLNNFFDEKHIHFDPRKGFYVFLRSKLSRSALVKNLQIHRSDFDDDALVSKGVSRIIANDWTGERHILYTLRILANRNMDLKTLTLTLGDEDKEKFKYIKEHVENWTMRALKELQPIMVQTLIIRGSGSLQRDHDISPSEKQVEDWISATTLKPERVHFSEPFADRRIKEDGVVILEEPNWTAINVPLLAIDEEELLGLSMPENERTCVIWDFIIALLTFAIYVGALLGIARGY